MDSRNAPLFSCPWRQVIDDGAIERNRAGIGLQHPGHEIDQRALAGAVLADEAVDLSRKDFEVDVPEDDIASKRLRQPGGRQHRPAVGLNVEAGIELFA